MRYLSIFRPEAGEEGAMPEPEHMAEMGRLVEEMMASGKLVGTEPLGMRSLGARVRLAEGVFTVGEETERAAGYAILNAGSRDEAIELTKTFLRAVGGGVCDVRQIMEFGAPPAQDSQ